jgi:hypothetical protein
MNRAGILALLIAVTPLTLCAQTAAPAPDAPATNASAAPKTDSPRTYTLSQEQIASLLANRMMALKLNANGCPVGMRVKRTGEGVTRFAGRQDRAIVSQLIHVSFTNPQAKTVVAAQVVVHGYNAEARIMPVASSSNAITKTIQLNLTESGKVTSTDVRLQSFAAVERVDLESLTYSDGTSWTSSPQKLCSVEPDALMLVGGL